MGFFSTKQHVSVPVLMRYNSKWGFSPSLSRLYSGTLVHRLYQELKSTPSVENLFRFSPKMSQLYQVLLNMMESTVPPDFFQKMTKTQSESCKKKKASTKKKKASRCVVPETQHLCNVNRFASLGVDDWKCYSWNKCHTDGRNYIQICDCIGICSAVFTLVPDSIFTNNSCSRDLFFVINTLIKEVPYKSCVVLFFFKVTSLIKNERKVVQDYFRGIPFLNIYGWLSLHFPLQKNLIKFVFEEHSDYSLTDQIKMKIAKFKNIVESVFTGRAFVLLERASFAQWQLSIVGTELYSGRNFSFCSPRLWCVSNSSKLSHGSKWQ